MILLSLVTCLCLLWVVWKKTRNGMLQPPTLPGCLPILGHTLHFLGDSKKAWETIQWIAKETLKQGGVSIITIGTHNGYVITDPDDCATAANACIKKNYYYSFAVPWLGDGLLTAEVPEWKRHRKIINPAFVQQVLNGFIGPFNSRARRLVQKWSSNVGPFRHHQDLCLNNLEMIYETTYGMRLENTKIKTEFEIAIEEILCILSERFKKFWLHNDCIYRFTNLKKKQDNVIKALHRISDSVVEERLIKRKQNNVDFRSFLDVMIEASEGKDYCNNKDLRENVDNIIWAGHDSVSSTLAIVLLILGSYPEVQNNAYNELYEIFGNSDNDVVKDDLNRMPYLEAVIKETLRLYPIAPVIARSVTSDVKLKNYTMKAGSSCYFFFNGIHLHEAWGPDAEQFRPERWLDPATKNPNLFTAFSIGKRVCIGKSYALMYMKTLLVHILRQYEIHSNISLTEFKLEIVLKTTKGDEITLIRRHMEKTET